MWTADTQRPSPEVCKVPLLGKPVDLKQCAVNGTAFAVASAGAFYGLYKSVDVLASKAETGQIACYGIKLITK